MRFLKEMFGLSVPPRVADIVKSIEAGEWGLVPVINDLAIRWNAEKGRYNLICAVSGRVYAHVDCSLAPLSFREMVAVRLAVEKAMLSGKI